MKKTLIMLLALVVMLASPLACLAEGYGSTDVWDMLVLFQGIYMQAYFDDPEEAEYNKIVTHIYDEVPDFYVCRTNADLAVSYMGISDADYTGIAALGVLTTDPIDISAFLPHAVAMVFPQLAVMTEEERSAAITTIIELVSEAIDFPTDGADYDTETYTLDSNTSILVTRSGDAIYFTVFFTEPLTSEMLETYLDKM